jgi:hypothetical protein
LFVVLLVVEVWRAARCARQHHNNAARWLCLLLLRLLQRRSA